MIQLEGDRRYFRRSYRGEGFAPGGHRQQLQVLASQPDFDRTMSGTVMENPLAAHPDRAAVPAQNDEMALVPSAPRQAAGNRGDEIVGFDGTDDGKAAGHKNPPPPWLQQQPPPIGAIGGKQ